MLLRSIPAIISFLLLGAHFLRSGHLLLTGACLLLPGLLLIRRQWSLQLLQFLLYIGAAVWVNTVIRIARLRINLGQSWGRMAIILGVVAGFTIISGLLLHTLQEKRS